MKVDVTVTEVKENGKTFLRLIEATKELRELSALATAIYNGSSDICWFLIKQDGFNVYPRKDGEVYDELFYFINDNYKMLADYADKFLDGWNMEIGDISHAEAIVWIMENMTDAWSKSPYSESFYSSKDIDWGYKPEGSLRVSDHWNFGADGEHCPTAEPVEGWAVCEYRDGLYHLVHKF